MILDNWDRLVWPKYHFIFQWMTDILFRSSHQRCSVKKVVLKDFANFTGEHPCWSLFLITLQVFRPASLLKRDSNTDVYLWNLRNFSEHLFWRTSAKEFFYLFRRVSTRRDLDRVRSSFLKVTIFFEWNAAISFIYKLKNVSITFQLTFSLKSWLHGF